MSDHLATVAQLYLYPVKSMACIPLSEVHVGLDGILGDRQYAFIRADQAARNSFPWMTARQSPQMLLHLPELTQAPMPEHPEPTVHVRTPAGATREVNDPALREELENLYGQPLFLLKGNRGMFDCQHLSLFSLSTVAALSAEADSMIDPRQFRANIYIEPASGQPFDEEAWAGHLLQIGDHVLAGVTQRDRRCMMINLDPATGTQDAKVLKAVAQNHSSQVGIYANVIRPGLVRLGDTIRLVAKH